MAAYDETLRNITLDAAANLAVDTSPPNNTGPGNQYRFVQVSGAHEADIYANAAGEICVGVLQNKPQEEAMAATVAIAGVSMVEASAAITAGDAVGSDASGLATSGNSPTLGIAVRGASAAGQLVPVLLTITGEAAV